MSIKYYHLAKDEELPDEFCAIKDIDGEPSEYVFYEPESDVAKLRELVKALLTCATDGDCDECRLNGATPWHVGKEQPCDGVWDRVRELGVEVDDAREKS